MTNDINSEVLVRVEGVSKKFCRDLKKSLWYGMKDVASELLPFGRQKSGIGDQRSADSSSSLTSDLRPPSSDSGLRPGEFWANKDISFELRRGECLGLIGRNGAGKTTLLKMLNGLIKPDSGAIEMRGRVAALIALGSGFNPILTGRENIYVNGSILGISKNEINTKIEDIIDFAEVRDFIDSPVQSYSSGMQVRLGFAVASSLSPDILILDEVLAVGDAAFRIKCYHRISEIRKNAAVIFVSHNMHQVARICDVGLTMSKGQVVFQGGIDESIENYDRLNQSDIDVGEEFLTYHPPLTSFIASAADPFTHAGTPFRLNIDWKADGELDDFLLRIVFINSSSENVADTTFTSKASGIQIYPGGGQWEFETSALPLKNGRYSLSVTLVAHDGSIIGWSLRQVSFDITGGSNLALTDCHLPAGIWKERRTAAPTH